MHLTVPFYDHVWVQRQKMDRAMNPAFESLAATLVHVVVVLEIGLV